MKVCNKCGNTLPLEKFKIRNKKTGRRYNQCILCIAQMKKDVYNKRRSHYIKVASKWQKNRYNDIRYKALKVLAHRHYQSILKTSAKSLLEINGSNENIIEYIESQFIDGMSWDNYGEWHIDHIRPCSSFDLTDPGQQKQCFHYTNLQPLWAEDNLKKSDKYIFEVA